ncbi:MAG TPA: ribbon-helix-helix domain-containing protein [Stellaceae bacterium]|nr:ribbon-helix-helix domain-containing protein [Stellaceae bacterium]
MKQQGSFYETEHQAAETSYAVTRDSTLVSGNVTVAGRRTSIRLEPQMWGALREICAREGKTVHMLVTEVDRGRAASSLTAAIRVHVMDYFRTAATEDGHRRAGHGAETQLPV